MNSNEILIDLHKQARNQAIKELENELMEKRDYTRLEKLKQLEGDLDGQRTTATIPGQ